MKFLKNIFLILFSVFVMQETVQAQIEYNPIDWGVHPMEFSNVGTIGWQFLKLHTNARSAAMGGVSSPLGEGNANSAFLNPASLADVTDIDVAFNYMNWVADIGYNSVSAVRNFGSYGIIGINMIYVDYGEEVRTEYQETVTVTDVIYTPVLDGLGMVSASDMAVGLSYAKQITEKLQVGGTIQYLRERIDDAKTSTWAINIGTVFYTGFRTLRVSMLGQNFGPDAEFREFENRIQTVPFSIKLPSQFNLGLAMDVIESSSDNPHRLLVAVDYIVPNDGRKKVNLGTEYEFMDLFLLRAGYRFNYDEEGLTLGAGLKYTGGGMRFNIDYAFIDTGIFDNVHMFTIGLNL